MNTLKDFYPTNRELINKMISGVKLYKFDTVLIPEAGEGDIIDILKENRHLRDNDDIDCIESNENRRNALVRKGYQVVHNDFLSYKTMKEYDLIIMNPPVLNGSEYLLRAMKLQKRNGGVVICLLDPDVIKNPYTDERKELIHMLSEDNAEIIYMQGLDKNDIALIRVKVSEEKRRSQILDSLIQKNDEVEYSQDSKYNLTSYDFIRDIVSQYEMEVAAGVQLIKEYNALSPFILTRFEQDSNGKTVQAGTCMLELKCSNKSYDATVNDYVREVRGKYWEALLSSPKFVGKLTSNLRNKYSGKISKLKDYEFSLYNIYEMKVSMTKNLVRGIEEEILALFDYLSREHSYYDEASENIHYYNGWKTNKSWIVNKKVIIPLDAFAHPYGGNKQYDPVRNAAEKLSDIEKCFNYLDGGLTESIDLYKVLESAKENSQTKRIACRYFSLNFFKKGTCWLEFNNEELLKKFNIFGSEHKGWLPPCYGKKKYQDMTNEEKSVIDSFQGEAEYNKVLCNKDYYLTDVGTMLKLDVAE